MERLLIRPKIIRAINERHHTWINDKLALHYEGVETFCHEFYVIFSVEIEDFGTLGFLHIDINDRDVSNNIRWTKDREISDETKHNVRSRIMAWVRENDYDV